MVHITQRLSPAENLIALWLMSTLIILVFTACSQGQQSLPTVVLLSSPTALPSKTPQPTQTSLPTETPPPTSTPEGELGSTWVRPQDGMEMVYVPSGTFQMGSTTGDPDEMPVHEVYLDAFWIDKHEVTQTMYARFDPSMPYGNLPAQNISWDQAAAYCAWVGGRLPSEAEWEKAARGPDGRDFPWGSEMPTGDLANFADLSSHLSWEDTNVNDGYSKTAPVGKYPAGMSIYGGLDMAGNVAEWVSDWYDEVYYSTSPSSNPSGPEDGIFRVLRGGSYYTTAAGIRGADRSWYIDEGSTYFIGFRCVQSTIYP